MKYTIMVTGGAGYIGTHMVKALLEAGHTPITIDNLSNGHQALLPGGAFIKGDISDVALLNSIFKSHPIDAVMHFAGFIEVGESTLNPLKYYRNNTAATMALLQTMIANNVKRFIFSSTAAVYGEPQTESIKEDHPCTPINPYGESKYFVEKILHSIDESNGMRFISLRYFNASGADPSGEIGERHNPETHLIPLILEVALKKRPDIKLFGTDYPTLDGSCIRDYVHVNDLANAHLLALNHLMDGGTSDVFNLGNSRGYSVKQVIDTAGKVTGLPIKVVEAHRRPGDPAILVADSTKIRKKLGWQPVYEDLEHIIQTAWHWSQEVNRKA